MKKESSHNKNHISRRKFINRTLAGTAAIALFPELKFYGNSHLQSDPWPANASKLRFHMIAQAHIDPVWLWPWSEGVSVVHSTFRSALDRMNETPDFCFTASSAQFFQWVAENDPAMLAEIRKRVEEGRWNIVGGWWVEPDVNIPCGESLVRQGLYGQLTFEKLVGRRATVAFNPDSFGHAGTLPQIFKLQGMENYVFMRPQPHEKSLPADIFLWEGPDGTQILNYRIPISYNDTGPVKNRIKQIIAQFKNQPVKSFMSFYGAGDHGGGATKEYINSILELQKEKGAPVVIFSTPERYFKEIREDKTLNLPVVKDDLQHHAVGCYTAWTEIKKLNRQSEEALITAEKISTIGSAKWEFDYPHEEFTRAWERVLFLQFHDSLAGTSLYDHEITVREGYGKALDTAHQAAYMALQKLEWQVPAEDPASQYILVFNPHAWEVKTHIEYDLNWRDLQNPSRVEDEQGNSLVHQWTSGSSEAGSRRKLILGTSIPPCSYRQLRIKEGNPAPSKNIVKAEGNEMENEYLRVKVSESGKIGIYDRENGIEIFTGGSTGCRAVVIDDPSDTWSHDIKSFTNEIGEFGKAVIKVIETGPLRAIIRSINNYGNSSLIIDWILYAGSRQLEANVTLDWHEHLKMLKFSFPVDVAEPTATFEIPYGHIVRETNGNEEPGQRWIDLTGIKNGNTYGLTVLNDAKYGYSVSGSDMRISVTRSAVYAHHQPKKLEPGKEYIWMDQGIQTFRMLLVPHKGGWQENNIIRIAEEFSSSPLIIYQGIHLGKMPKSDSFLSIDAANIIIKVIKKSEKNNDIIIRMIESLGIKSEANLKATFINFEWSGNFRPFEIKTLRINRKTGEIKEVNLLEE